MQYDVTQSVSDTTANRVTRVGDFGIGGGIAATIENVIANIDSATIPTGSGQTTSATTGTFPPGENAFGTLFTMRYNNTTCLQIWQSALSDHLYTRRYRSTESPMWRPWRKVWSQSNTTVDSNGFIKSASPILRLFADRTEEPVQDTGAAFERVSVGVYAITGTQGLAQTGWQIEVPKDHNGNRLCHIATGWAGGVLTISVSEPQWSDGNWIAGAPVDVPEGRWIDLRLHEDPPDAG
ncbi:pyocin knob domain-containing protein [Paracoccus sp. IB05]|uniref:pyocin knob domain-containing protein n=1 Tax=Paracoccus sp. IB05 TaxID=2779367 RepID=UPI0018E89209|nr:pyocin knob domain-containing protein [Paracoccus sp. IB05]MBJ2154076.1 hypothetical protein [Paracoccus sp. IB05]